MGAFYETIPDSQITWLLAQKLFHIATAPLSGNGHVNVSPKGVSPGCGRNFGVPSPTSFWYLDLSGSGNETISHLLEPGNGRITVQFEAFEGPPKIVRLWGKGRVLEHGSQAFGDFVKEQEVQLVPGVRSIVVVDVHQVGTSCGFSVPYYEYKGHRETLNELWKKREKKFLEGREEDSMERYWAYKNAWSMDGLPGMQVGINTAKMHDVAPMKKMVGPLAPTKYHSGLGFGFWQVVFIAILSFLAGLAFAPHGQPAMSVASDFLGKT